MYASVKRKLPDRDEFALHCRSLWRPRTQQRRRGNDPQPLWLWRIEVGSRTY